MVFIQWFLIFFLTMLNKNHASASIEEEFVILNRSQFTAAAVYLGTEMGRNWAVDITNQLIQETVKNPDFLLNWTIGSAIRGKTLVEALPIAEKRGSQFGAIIAAICAPLAFDASVFAWKSCKKSLRPLWDDNIPQKEKATTWDNIITSITSIGMGGGIIFMISKWNRH